MEPGFPFPSARWGKDAVRFLPDEAFRGADAPLWAALVFPFYGDRVVLANIRGRGYCIPSGRREEGETAEECARRETREETGAVLGRIVPLGGYILTDTETGEARQAPVFLAEVVGFSGEATAPDSEGYFLAAAEDIAGLYFSWDALMAAVFDYAFAQKQTRLLSGTSLADILGESEQ